MSQNLAQASTPEQGIAETLQLLSTGPRRGQWLKWLLGLVAVVVAIAFFAG